MVSDSSWEVCELLSHNVIVELATIQVMENIVTAGSDLFDDIHVTHKDASLKYSKRM